MTMNNWNFLLMQFLVFWFLNICFQNIKMKKNVFWPKKKIQLIQAKTLVLVAKKLNYFLILGKGKRIQKLSNIDKIIENSFEALI